MSDHIPTLIYQLRAISVAVSEPWVSEGIQRGSAAFQGDSVVFRGFQFRHTGPSYIFSESTPFQQFILDIRYGPY